MVQKLHLFQKFEQIERKNFYGYKSLRSSPSPHATVFDPHAVKQPRPGLRHEHGPGILESIGPHL